MPCYSHLWPLPACLYAWAVKALSTWSVVCVDNRSGQQNAQFVAFVDCRDSKQTEASFLRLSTAWWHTQFIQTPKVPKPHDLMILCRQLRWQTDKIDHFTPCTCAWSKKRAVICSIVTTLFFSHLQLQRDEFQRRQCDRPDLAESVEQYRIKDINCVLKQLIAK